MLTDEQKKYVTQAFVSLDERRTGSIPYNKEVLIEAIRLSGLNPTEAEVEQFMRSADVGEKLSKEDFLTMMGRLEWKSAEDVKETLLEDFRLFVDTSRVIKVDELIHILTREGRERLSVGEANKIVEKFQKDNTGNILIEDLIEKLLAIAPV